MPQKKCFDINVDRVCLVSRNIMILQGPASQDIEIVASKLDCNPFAQGEAEKFSLQSNKRNRKTNNISTRSRSREEEGNCKNRNFKMLQHCHATLRSRIVEAYWQLLVYRNGVQSMYCAIKRTLDNPFVVSKNKLSPKEHLKIGQVGYATCIPAKTCSLAAKQNRRSTDDSQYNLCG